MANDVKFKLSVDGAHVVSQEIDVVNRSMGQISSAAGAAAKALTGMMGGFSAALTIGKLISVQREFDVLNSSLITVTGSSAAAAKEMAWIKTFAKETPFGLAQATEGFVKMKALGLDPSRAALTSYGNTASAMGKDLNQMIEAVADASTGEFERLKEFGVKSKKEGDKVSLTFQGVTTTIGNNSKEITGYLEAIGNNQFAGAMAERAKTLDGAIAGLGDTWDELFRTVNTNNAGSFIYDSVTVATKAIEDATTILNALNDATKTNAKETGAMATIQEALGVSLETVAVIGANVKYVLFQVGNELGGLAAQSVQILQGNFAGAASIRQSMAADGIAARKEIAATTAAILLSRENSKTAAAINAQAQSRLARQSTDAPKVSAHEKETKDIKDKITAYDRLMQSISEKTAADQLDIQTQGNLTAGQKEAVKIMDDLRTGVLKLTDAEKIKLTTALESRLAAEKDKIIYESVQKATMEAAQKRADLRTKESASIEDYMAAESLNLQQTAHAAKEAARLAQEEFDNHGKLQSTIAATTLTRLQDQLVNKTAGTEAYDSLVRQIEAQKKLVDILSKGEIRDAGEKAAADMRDAQQKAAEESGKYWEDALMRAFESGKGFFDSLWSTIKNTLKTQVLKIAIQGVMGTAGIGSSGAAQGLGAIGGFGNAMGGLSTMGGIANVANMGYASMLGSGTSALFGATAGNAAMGTALLGSESAAIAAATAAAEAGGAASAAAASSASMGASMAPAAPYLLAAVAAYAIINGNKTKSSSNTGDASASYGADGTRLALDSTNALSSDAATIAAAMQKGYADTARALGITVAQSNYNVNTNSGHQGETPMLVLDSNVGGRNYSSGEIKAGDAAALALASSRAVLSALQASDMPQYLAGVFNTITASTATQAQINDTLAYAQALKTVREAMLETREPLQILQDAVTTGFADLATSADTFKRDFVAAIDAGLTPETFAAWNALNAQMQELAASAKSAASEVAQVAQATVNLGSLRDAALSAADTAVSALQRAVDARKGGIDAAFTTRMAGMDASLAAMQSANAEISQLAGSLKGFNARTGGIGLGDRASAQAAIDAALAVARSGGSLRSYSDSITGAMATLSQPAEQLYASFEDYARAQDLANNSVDELAKNAKAQLSSSDMLIKAVEAQRKAAEFAHAADIAALDQLVTDATSQLDALKGIDNSVLSVGDAIAQLAKTMGAASAAASSPGAATSPTNITAPTSVADMYAKVAGRAADPAGLAYWTDQAGMAGGVGNVMDAFRYQLLLHGEVPKFAKGTSYVPHDMTAMIHAGEEITPRPYVDAQRESRDETNSLMRQMVDTMQREMTAMRQELADIKRSSKKTADIADQNNTIGPAPSRLAA